MYAIFEAKGKQFRATPEMTLRIPSLSAEPGDRVTFDTVLLARASDEADVLVGRPALEGASVAVEVLRHGRDDKIVVYKMKRRKGYRRKQGHRQGYTEVKVVGIEVGTGKSAKPKKAEARKSAPKKTEAKAEKKQAPKKAAEEKPAPKAVAATIDATPTARTLAEEAVIDLASLDGSGKEGRILKSDVEAAIKARGGE